MPRPWHETKLNDWELNESVHDAMLEEGLDPFSQVDNQAFVDRANREAYEAGVRDERHFIEQDEDYQWPPRN